jgi:thiol-disulfide isomerase/thioredoxin
MTNATKPRTGLAGRSAGFWITLAVLAAAIFAYVMLVTRPANGPSGATGPAVGRRLGYLELEGLTGGAPSVSYDDLRGRVTLLNYWGTWCPPCVREFPDIVALADKFAAHDDFRLYAVSCGQGDDRDLNELRAETESFLEAAESKLPTYADLNGASRRAMATQLGLDGMAYPTTLLIDRQAVIRGFWVGYNPSAADEMARLIQQLLDEPADDAPPAEAPPAEPPPATDEKSTDGKSAALR